MVRKVYLYSYGGCCLGMMMDHLFNCGIETNPLKDVWNGNPPEELSDDEAFIYLYGDPVLSLLSFYGQNRIGTRTFIQERARDLEVKVFDQVLENYAARGIDQFGFRNHIAKYSRLFEITRGRRLMLNAEGIWSNADKLKYFLETDVDVPPRQPRSNKFWVSSFCMEGLDRMYRPLNKLIDENDKFIFAS